MGAVTQVRGTATTEAPAHRKSARPLLFIGVVVLIAAAAVGYKELHHAPPPTGPVPGAVVDLPETTVNLPNGHLLQVALAMELVKGEKLVGPMMAALQNSEIDILSSFHYSVLLTTAGKTRALAALRSGLNAALKGAPGQGVAGGVPPGTSSAGSTRVLGAYFTYFVMQ